MGIDVQTQADRPRCQHLDWGGAVRFGKVYIDIRIHLLVDVWKTSTNGCKKVIKKKGGGTRIHTDQSRCC